MEAVLYGNTYKSWSYDTAPLTSRLIHRGGYPMIGFESQRRGKPQAQCIRAGNTAENVETRGLDRVGLWKQPSLGPDIRLLESCGAGGVCRVASRARVAILRCVDVSVERSFYHVARNVLRTVFNRCRGLLFVRYGSLNEEGLTCMDHWGFRKHSGRTSIEISIRQHRIPAAYGKSIQKPMCGKS